MTLSRHLRRLLAALALSACAAAPLAAQTPETPRPLRVQLYYWHRSNSTYIETLENFGKKPEPRFLEPITLWYRNGEKFESVRVRAGQRSPVFTVAAGGEIAFFREDPSAMKEIPPEIVVRVAVPPHVRQGLIIARDPALKRAEVIDVSDTRIPRGALRLLNQTGEPIAVKTGDQVLPIKPGEASTLSPKPDAEGRIDLKMARPNKDGQWGIFYSSVVSVDKENRMLAMIYPSSENAKNVKVQLMTVPD